jgi:hypothetical protein
MAQRPTINGFHPVTVHPIHDLIYVKSHITPDLHERNTAFVDHSANVTDPDAQRLRHRLDVDEPWQHGGRTTTIRGGTYIAPSSGGNLTV